MDEYMNQGASEDITMMSKNVTAFIVTKAMPKVWAIRNNEERQKLMMLNRLAKLMFKARSKSAFAIWAEPTKELKKRKRAQEEEARKDLKQQDADKRRRLIQELRDRLPGVGIGLPKDLSTVECLEDIAFIKRM